MVKMVHLVFSPRHLCLVRVFCGSIQTVGLQFQFQSQGYFHRDHIKSVDCFGWYILLNSISSTIREHGNLYSCFRLWGDFIAT